MKVGANCERRVRGISGCRCGGERASEWRLEPGRRDEPQMDRQSDSRAGVSKARNLLTSCTRLYQSLNALLPNLCGLGSSWT